MSSLELTVLWKFNSFISDLINSGSLTTIDLTSTSIFSSTRLELSNETDSNSTSKSFMSSSSNVSVLVSK